MIVIDSMMNRSIRFVSVMNAGAARLRFRFPLVAITIGSRDGPCGFTIVIRCCNVVRASRQMSRAAMKANSRLYTHAYIYIYIYILISDRRRSHAIRDLSIFLVTSTRGEKPSPRITTVYPCRVGKIVEREIRVDGRIFTFHNLPRDIQCGKRLARGEGGVA